MGLAWETLRCDRCKSRPAEAKVRAACCVVIVLCGPCQWATQVPESVKERVARKQEESDVKTWNNKPEESQERKHPEFLALSEGEEVVGVAVNIRHDVPGKFGKQTVLDCAVKGQDKLRSIGWPRKCIIPPMSTPFKLRRVTKGGDGMAAVWDFGYAETAEEAEALWPKFGDEVARIKGGAK